VELKKVRRSMAELFSKDQDFNTKEYQRTSSAAAATATAATAAATAATAAAGYGHGGKRKPKAKADDLLGALIRDLVSPVSSIL